MKKVIIILLLASILVNIIQTVHYEKLKSKFLKISSESDKTFEYMDTLTVDSFIKKLKMEKQCVCTLGGPLVMTVICFKQY